MGSGYRWYCWKDLGFGKVPMAVHITVPDRRGSVVEQVPSDPLSVQLYLYVLDNGSMVYSGSLVSPGLCGVMWSRDMPLLHSSHSTPPPTQASIDSVHLQPCRGVDLNGAHQEGSVVAKSMISGCWTIYLNIAIIYFPSSTTFFRALLKYFVCLVLITIFFRLIHHNNGIKLPCAFITFSGCGRKQLLKFLFNIAWIYKITLGCLKPKAFQFSKSS
jgi:hypothetical protein